MSAERDAMDAALKQVLVGGLRKRGFTGSLPHLRRRLPERIDLLTVQYHSAGGRFVVEVAACEPGGVTTSWGKQIPPAKVKAHDINPPNRPRLGSADFPRGDHWFVFGSRSYEPAARPAQPEAHYERIAAEVLTLVDQQAQQFWEAAANIFT